MLTANPSRQGMVSPDRRQSRRALPLAPRLSWIVFGIVLALWVRSDWVCEQCTFSTSAASVDVQLWHGVVLMNENTVSQANHPWFIHFSAPEGRQADGAFRFRQASIPGEPRLFELIFPLWLVAALFAIPPLFSAASQLSRRLRLSYKRAHREDRTLRLVTPVFVQDEPCDISKMFGGGGVALPRRTPELDRQLETAWASARAKSPTLALDGFGLALKPMPPIRSIVGSAWSNALLKKPFKSTQSPRLDLSWSCRPQVGHRTALQAKHLAPDILPDAHPPGAKGTHGDHH